MRSVAFGCVSGIIAAVLLTGCMRDPYVTSQGDAVSGNWRIAQQRDRVTGNNLPSVSVMALASNTYDDYPKPAMMQLTCFDRKPLVRFAFDWKVGSDANTVLGYRFDDKPGRDSIAGARFLQQHRLVVIEETSDIAQFVSDLEGSQLLYVRVRSITNGRTTAEFKLDGSAAALRAAFADCPLTPSTASAKKPVS